MQQRKNKKELIGEGYSLPEGYFTEFKQQIMSKINKPKDSGLKISYNNILIKSGLIAASFLLLLTLIPNKELSIDTEDLISYVESTGIEGWDEDIIIEAISLENIKDEKSEELINFIEDTDLETILEKI